MTKPLVSRWLITDKGDQDVRRLIDGETTGTPPHYCRQSPGNRQYTRNGQNLVFITPDLLAGWITFRPTPGKAVRADGLDAWECAIFRNDGGHLSSSLIREAIALTYALWGRPPRDGIITFVDPRKVRSGLPGYCYRRAGWRRVGYARDGKPRFRAPRVDIVPHWSFWSFKGDRGGVLRTRLGAA